MDKQGSPRLAQDLSSLVASVLPILQLFFTQLPNTVTNTFLAQKQFTGISIITLLLSYVLIIAFQAKPYFEIVMPWQRKKYKAYMAYQNRMSQAAGALESLGNSGVQHDTDPITSYVESLKEKPLERPNTFQRDNLISVSLIIVILSSAIFIIFAFVNYSTWAAVIQSISYVLLIVFSVLILFVYRSTIQNNARFEEESNTKVARAIELATSHNVFGTLPNVRVVESFDAPGFPANLNIVAEYAGDYYHVITDPAAKRLIRGRKLDAYQENGSQ